ncbi:hypothetical protein D3C72_694510 [compost metagenome]
MKELRHAPGGAGGHVGGVVIDRGRGLDPLGEGVGQAAREQARGRAGDQLGVHDDGRRGRGERTPEAERTRLAVEVAQSRPGRAGGRARRQVGDGHARGVRHQLGEVQRLAAAHPDDQLGAFGADQRAGGLGGRLGAVGIVGEEVPAHAGGVEVGAQLVGDHPPGMGARDHERASAELPGDLAEPGADAGPHHHGGRGDGKLLGGAHGVEKGHGGPIKRPYAKRAASLRPMDGSYSPHIGLSTKARATLPGFAPT